MEPTSFCLNLQQFTLNSLSGAIENCWAFSFSSLVQKINLYARAQTNKFQATFFYKACVVKNKAYISLASLTCYEIHYFKLFLVLNGNVSEKKYKCAIELLNLSEWFFGRFFQTIQQPQYTYHLYKVGTIHFLSDRIRATGERTVDKKLFRSFRCVIRIRCRNQ